MPKYKKEWQCSFGNNIGWLVQRMPAQVQETNTIFFIHKHQKPTEWMRDITHGRILCGYCNGKVEPNWTRLTVGGDTFQYPGDHGIPTAHLLLVKIILNSVISTPWAKFMTMDVKIFYLNTPMTKYEYRCLHMSNILDDVIQRYQLQQKATNNGYINVEIRKGMYGLRQVRQLAQDLLERLKQHGYYQSHITPGLWLHKHPNL